MRHEVCSTCGRRISSTREQRRQRNEAMAHAYQGGKSRQELANEYGISRRTINTLLPATAKRLGIQLRRVPGTGSPEHDRNTAIYAEYQDGKSCHALAEKYGVSKQRVYQITVLEAKRRGKSLRKPIKGPPRVQIDRSLLERVSRAEITYADARLVCGSFKHTINAALIRAGLPLPTKRAVTAKGRKAHARYAEMYRLFMEDGLTLKDLAKRYKISVLHAGQCLTVHRRLTGAPAKQTWDTGRNPVMSHNGQAVSGLGKSGVACSTGASLTSLLGGVISTG